MTTRILTGIKPTGTPHIGNYFGTFEPALRRSDDHDESYLFIANYHALNQVHDGATLEKNTLTIAATWLACGLDTEKTFLYAQSDIPEEIELATMLMSFTPKGWMNKAHAYKAASDKNREAGKPDDDSINMGLYTYPILMAADILIFNANTVPVGKDQVQHVEIARDIATKINHEFGQELLTIPEHRVEEEVGTVVGTDGRKMSKSYDNVLPLFASPEERLKAVNKIVTDSSAPDEKKQVEGTAIYEIYRLVASDIELQSFKSALEDGQLGWGDAKKQLSGKMDEKFGAMTEEFNRLMADPAEIRLILKDGASMFAQLLNKILKNYVKLLE